MSNESMVERKRSCAEYLFERYEESQNIMVTVLENNKFNRGHVNISVDAFVEVILDVAITLEGYNSREMYVSIAGEEYTFQHAELDISKNLESINSDWKSIGTDLPDGKNWIFTAHFVEVAEDCVTPYGEREIEVEDWTEAGARRKAMVIAKGLDLSTQAVEPMIILRKEA